MKDTEIMASALRILADDMESADGVPNMCLRDAATMIEQLVERIAELEAERDESEKKVHVLAETMRMKVHG